MRWGRLLLLGSVLLGLCGVAWAYKYWDREELAADLAGQVGEKVKVVDEIVSIYPDKQTIEGYFKFGTVHFRCLIPNDKSESIDYVKKTATERLEGSRRTKRLVVLEATVERREVYGGVGGKDAGVSSEAIFLVVDKASRPRARYYRELP